MNGKTGSEDVAAHVSGQSNEPISRPAHSLTADEVAVELDTNQSQGLSADEAAQRLHKYGPNNLGQEKGVSAVAIFMQQIFNSMTLVLLLALAASFAIKAWIEGGVLGGMILLNIFIGFYQDLQAQRTIASLSSLNSPSARVVREGHSETVDAETLVPGDIVELKTGDVVPADARIIECVNLEADEAALTGESVPVRKDPTLVFGGGSGADSDSESDDVGPGDRLNVVFSSTTITKGRGKAIVFATGMCTEIGAIAAALRAQGDTRKLNKDENGKSSAKDYIFFALGKVWDAIGEFLGLNVGTPLQRKLSALFLIIFGIAILCAIIVMAANEFSSRTDVIIYAITTAIGTLPVTLILVLTITMAAGTKVMIDRHVLVRNMRSLEALGGVTNICSDKTGTLTQGKMVARMAWMPGHGTYSLGVTNEPYNPESADLTFTPGLPKDMTDSDVGNSIEVLEEEGAHAPLRNLLDVAQLANLATVKRAVSAEDGASWNVNGDPTEIAIQVFAARFGRNRDVKPSFDDAAWNQLVEFPFDSSIKKMSVVCRNKHSGNVMAFTKGAVERVLESCDKVAAADGTKIEGMSDKVRTQVIANMEAFARRGLRVLAFASRASPRAVTEDEVRLGSLKREEFEDDMVFRGLVGIYDPPRPETRPSVFKCHQAGIAVHMLTGDHPETARTIAIEVGILPSRMDLLPADIAKQIVMTAHDFDKLSDDEVDQLPQLPLVVARCAPSTKVRMIDALHRRGRYVAMTGDGVNDSPSLHRADVGIAMGLNGSDVAKSASDIVLSDDNFASILNAVEEGRRIFDNIQKFMLHVLAANVGFVTALLIGLAYKDSTGVSVFQMTPIEILFMLLVGGTFTETGLGFEGASPDILRRPPQSLKHGVFTPEFLLDLVVYGVLMAVCTICTFVAVMFGIWDGDFGENCNIEWGPTCEGVFRARSTCFTVFTWIFLFFAWVLCDARRSFFDGMIHDTRNWAHRLWRNPFLFWSIVGGILIIIPTLYIPTLNTYVFLHVGIDLEWTVVFAAFFFFVASCESWKWAKRVYLRRNNLMLRKGEELGEEDLEARVFDKFFLGESEGENKTEK